MPSINVLAEEVIKKIAAGEVVDGPYSIIKELVENSIDAGAKRLDISVERGGLVSIRVTDDGSGMDRDDAVLAFKRHATSKIKEADEIIGITTLGFRGEALPSISAVSRVTCTTRPEGAHVGTKVTAEVELVDCRFSRSKVKFYHRKGHVVVRWTVKARVVEEGSGKPVAGATVVAESTGKGQAETVTAQTRLDRNGGPAGQVSQPGRANIGGKIKRRTNDLGKVNAAVDSPSQRQTRRGDRQVINTTHAGKVSNVQNNPLRNDG